MSGRYATGTLDVAVVHDATPAAGAHVWRTVARRCARPIRGRHLYRSMPSPAFVSGIFTPTSCASPTLGRLLLATAGVWHEKGERERKRVFRIRIGLGDACARISRDYVFRTVYRASFHQPRSWKPLHSALGRSDNPGLMFGVAELWQRKMTRRRRQTVIPSCQHAFVGDIRASTLVSSGEDLRSNAMRPPFCH